MNSVDYSTLFNDGNSKAWLVNKVIYDNSIISPLENYEKNVMIFYSSRRCDLIAMKNIAREAPQKANYYLNSRMHKLTIEFSDFEMDFHLSYITEDSILMTPTHDSDYVYSIQLIPFPEL